VGSPVGWHPVERALQVSAGVENITAKSTPKKDVLVTAQPHFIHTYRTNRYSNTILEQPMNIIKSQWAAFSINVNLSMHALPAGIAAIELDRARKTGCDKTKIQI
jgi:hypothetical protein